MVVHVLVVGVELVGDRCVLAPHQTAHRRRKIVLDRVREHLFARSLKECQSGSVGIEVVSIGVHVHGGTAEAEEHTVQLFRVSLYLFGLALVSHVVHGPDDVRWLAHLVGEHDGVVVDPEVVAVGAAQPVLALEGALVAHALPQELRCVGAVVWV